MFTLASPSFLGKPKPAPPIVEFLRDLVYFTTYSTEPRARDGVVFFSIDEKLSYNNFYLDFGPHNLGSTFQFCSVMNKMVTAAAKTRRKIIFYSAPDPQLRTNAVCLLACWGILFHDMSAERAYAPFTRLSFPAFHDASPAVCEYKLTILDCLQGLERALKCGFVYPKTFNIHEYHHYEQVENGDLTWISPKFIAFAGPQQSYNVSSEGYVMLTPEHYMPYFVKNNVTLVVRLNEKEYDETQFTRKGITHLDLYYPDGATPPPCMLQRFLQACESTPGAVAVHCKAGLGRTGTCIAAYLMKHFHFTAKQVIGWLRLCRPGSVIGPQQEYLESIQSWMWELDDRKSREILSDVKKQGSGSSRVSGLLTTRAINVLGVKNLLEIMERQNTQGDHLMRLKRTFQAGTSA